MTLFINRLWILYLSVVLKSQRDPAPWYSKELKRTLHFKEKTLAYFESTFSASDYREFSILRTRFNENLKKKKKPPAVAILNVFKCLLKTACTNFEETLISLVITSLKKCLLIT